MKRLALLHRPSIVRDSWGFPNFKSAEEIRSVFSDEEVSVMVNHYLMTATRWDSVDADNFDCAFREKSPLKKRQLKKGVPLVQQLVKKES